MDLMQAALIAIGGFAAGAMNALAGGGTFFSFPTLLAVGIAPVTANATNAVALWPASVSAALALRPELRRLSLRHYLVPLMAAAAIGGLVGGVLLLLTSNQLFYRLVPWLLLLATLLFTFSPWLGRQVARLDPGQGRREHLTVTGFFAQLAVSLYGGFFGAGMGIMMIASLAISGHTQIARINAIKSLMSSVIYSVAALTFIIAGAVHWPALGIMLLGTVSGGYCGGLIARWLPNVWLRRVVTAIAWGLTLYYFHDVYA